MAGAHGHYLYVVEGSCPRMFSFSEKAKIPVICIQHLWAKIMADFVGREGEGRRKVRLMSGKIFLLEWDFNPNGTKRALFYSGLFLSLSALCSHFVFHSRRVRIANVSANPSFFPNKAC